MLLLLLSIAMIKELRAQTLKVSDNKRYLTNENGKPFFWLGDTAWELFHRTTREEATQYLENRKAKGFTVVQAVVWSELDGASSPNAYGYIPFFDNNPLKPNQKYFEHVDFVVNQAQKMGLFIGMLPTWGDKVSKGWGKGPEVFTPENAYKYGKWIANRYKDKPIIWILGGDRNPKSASHLEIYEQMAKGIKEGSTHKQLVTFHPMGNSSSATYFHQKEWLDFNMAQSGHAGRDFPNFLFMLSNYYLAPTKPTLDGEPRYEDIPLHFWELKLPDNWAQNPTAVPDSSTKWGFMKPYDVRRAAYMAMMAGACGHTYGHNSIWQMWQKGYSPAIPMLCNWKDALDKPGAVQMNYFKKFFDSFEWYKGVPAQHLIPANWTHAHEYNMALAANDGSYIAVYSSYGHEVNVYTWGMPSEKIKVRWFNPVTGEFFKEETIQKPFELKLTHPQKETDWVILITTN